MPNAMELTTELASLHADRSDLDRCRDELPAGAHIRALLHLAMNRLDDRIHVVERNLALAYASPPARLGAAA